MDYKNITGTELDVSAICLGGGSFCLENGKEHSFELMDAFFEQGGNFIDTANVYGKWLPEGKNISEIVIGQWMKERNHRNQMVIATKGGCPNLDSMHIPRLSKKEVLRDLDESSRSLQTDVIDLYWLHRDDETLPVAAIIDYLNDFVKEGRIRYFGCSNWKLYRIKEAMNYAKKHQLKSFEGNQIMWSLAVPNEDAFDDKTMLSMNRDYYDYHVHHHFTAIPYSSQAGGFFEKERNASRIPLADGIKRIYLNQVNRTRANLVDRIANELSISITEVVLAYLMFQPFPTIPIIGCSSVEQLKKSLKAGEMKPAKEIVELIKKTEE